ncbi:MAG: S8 family serine peptidase [Luteolibacter sp.]
MKGKGVNLVALNASYGGADSSVTERDAIQAAGNAGIIFCAAAGNEGTNNDTTPKYPANYRLSNMIVVAASDQNDALATFSTGGSNYGATTVDLAAPGKNIYSTVPSGTSSADTLAVVNAGGTLFTATPLLYSGSGAVTGNLVNCGIGSVGQFPPAVSGNIALIQRGTINFSDKVTNAAAAGAKAVVIYNNVAGASSFTLGSSGTWLPTCAVSQADGATLVSTLPVTTVNIGYYGYLSGTSMATPQVTGAVSLAAMCYPEDTVAQRVQRILSAVDVKASLSGKTITSGRLNLQKLVDSDLNGLPDWWEKLYYNQYTGIVPNADSDGDGLSNLNEFLAGTVPTNAQSAIKNLATTRNATTGNVTITWSAVPGKTYQVYYSTTLQSGSWLATLPSSLLTAGTGQTQLSYTDTTTGSAVKRFYRVVLVVP